VFQIKNTLIFNFRYITVTRTYTNTQVDQSTISPTIVEATMAPVFQTETIPAPENILATSSLSFDNSALEISSGNLFSASQCHIYSLLKKGEMGQ